MNLEIHREGDSKINLWGVLRQAQEPSKTQELTGWWACRTMNPMTTTFEQLVELMVRHDMAKVAAENAAEGVRKMNLAEYLEKGIVK